MDRRTQETLKKITMEMPRYLSEHLMKVKYDDSEEELARAALDSDFISDKKKHELRIRLDRGEFKRSENVIDEEVQKEIDLYFQTKIDKARREGRLGDPNNDPWYRERMKRIAAHE